jgi:midasin
LGANLPSPEGDAGEFVWSDGPLLQAMKSGSWVLLDELNLAGQSILEGLNALLDHRGEIFVPELNVTIACAAGFRLFGAQNPVQEGGGRKGLPKSFLNRFIRVRVSGFSLQDLLNISHSIYARIPEPVLLAMTECLWQCASRVVKRGVSGLDFNLRDLLRWCKLVEGKMDSTEETHQASDLQLTVRRWSRLYGSMLLTERMRSSADRDWVECLLDERLLPAEMAGCVDRFDVGPDHVTIGTVQLRRKTWEEALREGPFRGIPTPLAIPKSYFGVQESLSESVKNNWLSILVGATGTGRSSSVAALAHLLGKQVVEIPMHPGIDISDLLGGFEQVDVDRESLAMLDDVKSFLRFVSVVGLREG